MSWRVNVFALFSRSTTNEKRQQIIKCKVLNATTQQSIANGEKENLTKFLYVHLMHIEINVETTIATMEGEKEKPCSYI